VELLEHCPLENLQADADNTTLMQWLLEKQKQYPSPPPPPPKRIPLEECKHGSLYRLSSRNLGFGVFVEATKGFVGIRTKFDHRYLFTEFHWDTGEPFGTVLPQEYLEDCPLDDLREGWLGENEKGEQCYLSNTALFEWLDEKQKQYRKEESTP
jgi:hypothetical protein